MITEERIYKALQQVMDPEIPVLSVLELGMITKVAVSPDEQVLIEMIPTFAACPAIHFIKDSIKNTLEKELGRPVNVAVNKTETWNSNRLSAEALEKLKNFGLAAPQPANGNGYVELMLHTPCPHCGGTDTYLRSPFGSTLCRAQHYCKSCGQLFEQFKPVD